MSEHGDAYRSGRARLTALVSDLDDDALERPVPACPGWRVKDVCGHLVGLAADVMDRNTDGAGSDAWTAAQVDARRGRTVDELIAEWDERGPELEALLDKLKPAAAHNIVGDIATHEADVRGALGRVDGRESDAVRLAFDGYVRHLAGRITQAGLPALRVGGLVAGDGEPASSVDADRFELLRALTGRRTVEQVRAFGWTGDAETYLPIFSSYGVPESPIVE